MAYSTMPRTTTIYKDFEPAYEWSQEQNSDTLLIYLPDFKKEDIKVQIDNYGNLRVEGERRLERNQRLRFSKDFEIPDNCNVDDIRANFRDGLLYIWLPKLITKAELEEEKPKVTQKPEEQKPNNQKKETDEKQSTRVQEELEKIEQPKKDHERDDKKKEEFSWPDGISEVKEKEKEVGNGMKKENGSLALDKSQQRKLLINVAVAFMVLVGLGMYVTFKMSKS
ncbi:inactive protein RESTRICTED TEV MOVEMENT 2-like [Dioscorea cayenensis subsp. rotundata]|uniref:Inactive protein RESTRICTED TEV MOVEMENT 2-like n=1 Tax=Dioscorea cayennensis subsp. rotundata TaxID=55577 RepID=A0AB40BWZ1_DIOCR|nr:inactive protein RESTRICTED TEV MOVEMENT 2-like [Dioscorea cayenensis subsp. rotundata]